MDIRLKSHPIIDFESKRGKPIHFLYRGKRVKAYEGETIAAALWASGIKTLHRSQKYHRPRGLFCAIGKCSSCLMTVNGIPNVKTCIKQVKKGMVVETQNGKGVISSFPSTKKTERYKIETDIAVVGGGPAGLSAAIIGSQLGPHIVLIDENPEVGGQLVKQTHKFFGLSEFYACIRGIEIAKLLSKQLKNSNAKIITGTSIIGYYQKGNTLAGVENDHTVIEICAKKIIVATGSREKFLAFPNNDLPGVLGAGAVQTLMNYNGIKPGENALIVGSGNVGLIVGWQLLQAGVNVKAVVEVKPRIGGYLVHAAKLRRMGVRILTSHTITRAMGKDFVEGATIVEVDNEGEPVKGTEQEIDVNLICLAVGLTPSSELLFQAGCEGAYLPELGGYVPLHNVDLETTRSGIYIAGDASGIEEADTAMLEGKIAGADAALRLGFAPRKSEKIKNEARGKLNILRRSPFRDQVKIGKQKMLDLIGEYNESKGRK